MAGGVRIIECSVVGKLRAVESGRAEREAFRNGVSARLGDASCCFLAGGVLGRKGTGDI